MMTKDTRDNLITALYDKYGKGEISVTQREQLIQKINDKFYTEAVSIMAEKAKEEKTEEPVVEEPKSEEPVAEEPATEEPTPCSTEKFDTFKKAVEEKCKKGEITEEIRDQLLEKAKEVFCSAKSE